LTIAGQPANFRPMSAQRVRSRAAAPVHTKPSLRFSPINGILLAAGIGAVILGYSLLSKGSTVAAPLLLVLGYALLIPLGIIL
jgi:hypothetical protein